MISDYGDDNYANINDIEYIFGDIDNYYQPILTSFNNGYQRYHFRGDPNRNMSVTTYFDKIIPYLRVLIDENKLYEQKIQLDMGINMVHISEQKSITHFSKSDNIIFLPSSDTNEIINQLLTSLYEKYQHDLTVSHESSSFSYESVEELNIHFNKIDLKRGASFIETPKWLKSKKATINPKNAHDVYCFIHAITIALYHKELGTNPERITKKLIAYAQKFNCHDIDFPASYQDYVIFKKLNEDVALNVLYVSFNEVNILPEYISKRNFNIKNQVTLLKITDDTGKWHFLALPSILDEDGVKRPTKSLSRLMEGIASKSHSDFYFYGCFHSFCTQSTLRNHVELCKYNDFCKIELPKEGRKIKQYSPGAKSLKMNSAIYADFESILLPYSTCDKENVKTKKLNKQVPCGYSINVITNHNNQLKQTYYCGDSTVANFCKEIRDIAQDILNIEKKPMQNLADKELISYDNAKHCHICKKVFGKKKNHIKVRDHDRYTGKYRGKYNM